MISEQLDITSIEYTENPYKWYELLRQTGNIHYLEKNQSWFIIGFSECLEVLNNPHVFSSEGKYQFDPILLNCDPPKHTYHKRILSGEGALFSNNRVDMLAIKNQQICINQLKMLNGCKYFDFLHDFALPYSSLVILALLGIETDNNKALLEWSKEAISTKSIQNRNYAHSNWTALLPMITSWVDEAYNKPDGKGLPEIIFHIQAQKYFSKDQLINLVKILILGGNETTPTLASSALYHLVCNPGLMEDVRHEKVQFEIFINEVLRFYAPTQIIARTTKTDIVIGGMLIPANSLVNVGIGAANRDPDFFENPNDFYLDRPKGRILSFGHGAHHCIGASLAKQETRIIFEELFSRYKSIAISDSFIPEYRKSTHIRGLEYLPIIVN
jgi:cytochrome P450